MQAGVALAWSLSDVTLASVSLLVLRRRIGPLGLSPLLAPVARHFGAAALLGLALLPTRGMSSRPALIAVMVGAAVFYFALLGVSRDGRHAMADPEPAPVGRPSASLGAM